ncbi:glycosyltransferase [Bizionia arctica]|uniref:N-acetylgalactosamine-N, N'-diacetylbacillosaminyl-diphospho-undecaprenol 4-alpha-N-acetylgalactosaminyltransferase n=1 Tax=Bizionia arctica TaxID=1495645 RepID=A0A917LPN2_9FLAO|nr:glycosyltransferase [Bizionia arctica]GGG48480.1 N-acetylgalactosamine-N,N'-diacetylbacillosaminyl-diphospho-undecaprenol 4-alpha-N-acetylgalactosaminyltransferase [Bizionia arctica]
MTNKTKIALFIPAIGFGGAEKVVSLLTFELTKYYDVTLILLYDIIKLPISKDIKVILLSKEGEEFKTSKAQHFSDYIKFIFKYQKVLKTEKIDVVISFMLRQNAMTGIAKMFNPTLKSIISERCFPSKRYNNSKLISIISKTMIPFFYNRNDRLFSNSIHINQDLRTHFNVKIDASVIYNPTVLNNKKLNSDNYSHPPDIFKIVTVGRLTAVKNQKHILNSLSKLPEHFRLDIYGDGDILEELEQLSINLNLKDRVNFKGNVLDVHSKIFDSHCFVLSSLTEGFPNALLEALSLGIPVIATNCMSGPLELLNENEPIEIENGSFFKAKYGILINIDDVEGLTKAITYLQENQEQRITYSELGYNRAKDYGVDKIGLKLKSLIDSI